LDIDSPKWQPLLVRLQKANVDIDLARKQGGPLGFIKRMAASARAVTAFLQLLLIPSKGNAVPASPRLEPVY